MVEREVTKEFIIVRKHPRVNVDILADWGWGPECEYYDRVTSLSLGGCFLATKHELHAGDRVFLELTDQTIGKVNLKGAIKYRLRVMEGGPPKGAGVQFISVTEDSELKLQAVLDGYR